MSTPFFRGLRIRVKDALDLLAAGATTGEIVADYPYLDPEEGSATPGRRNSSVGSRPTAPASSTPSSEGRRSSSSRGD